MFREVRPKSPGVVRMATVVVASVLTVLAGCRRGSVDDLLAAGDSALQATKVAEAQQNYEKAEKIA
ncbi:MAG TPA: hypothetical protein VEF03_11515, partial [Candidatus Binataceae bacterium]|nr:hypothetical protein [Candidatus Binataceae bacterium]